MRRLAGRIGRWLAAWDRSGGPERELLAEAASFEPREVPCGEYGRAWQCRAGHHHAARDAAVACGGE